MKKISIIIPCYNEMTSIKNFYYSIKEVFKNISYEYELIFIDDGSKDDTLKIIKEYAQINKNVKYISFSRNFGKESAIYAGFCNVKGDYIASMDVDMQDPPSLLPKMIEILETKDFDCVATKRSTRKNESKIKSFFSELFYKIMNKVSNIKIANGARDFRLMKKKVVDEIIKMKEKNRFSKGIFEWVGFKTYWISYENIERFAGESKWNFFSLFKYAINGFMDFSFILINIILYVGIITIIVSILLALIFIIKYFLYHIFSKFIIINLIIMFSSGINFIFIGIIGKYVSNIYLEVKDRQNYIIRDTNINE